MSDQSERELNVTLAVVSADSHRRAAAAQEQAEDECGCPRPPANAAAGEQDIVLDLEVDATTLAFARVVSTLHRRGVDVLTLTWSSDLRRGKARITVTARVDRQRHEHIRKALTRLVDVTTVRSLAGA
ncbi:hypothetical protein [Dactylosporangium sp. CA-233914]|uniref:hypothetical protein n=1 Tax=Dactylosporangium sp. CA-233914 TaxID=3239934 RepID=UPI003D903634